MLLRRCLAKLVDTLSANAWWAHLLGLILASTCDLGVGVLLLAFCRRLTGCDLSLLLLVVASSLRDAMNSGVGLFGGELLLPNKSLWP